MYVCMSLYVCPTTCFAIDFGPRTRVSVFNGFCHTRGRPTMTVEIGARVRTYGPIIPPTVAAKTIHDDRAKNDGTETKI